VAPLPDTPLAGVPFLVKDLVYIEGVPCTYGSRLYADNVPDRDATVVRRFREAGLVIFGKTNTPEFGLNVATEPALFGPTRNPQGPDVGEGWNGMSTGHVVSRSVRDTAAFLDAIHGPEPGDPYWAPPFQGSYLREHAAALVESLGHRVGEASPEFDRERFGRATSTLVAGNIALNISTRLEALGRDLADDDIEPHTRMTMAYGHALTAEDYAKAAQVIHQTGRATARFHETWDLMLTPVLLSPPVPVVGWIPPTTTPRPSGIGLQSSGAIPTCRTQRASRRSRYRCTGARKGCQSGCSSSRVSATS
jgi:Asp-tRNA(Asn)/Glu-tRNA(Gln) amidotransferase A subunit family amidase